MLSKRLSVVCWNDAHATLNQSSQDEVRGSHHPELIHTYGYIVISDDAGISIAGEWVPANGGEDSYRSITFVPRAMVISATDLSPKRPRKIRPPLPESAQEGRDK